jgi:hypothetical protein
MLRHALPPRVRSIAPGLTTLGALGNTPASHDVGAVRKLRHENAFGAFRRSDSALSFGNVGLQHVVLVAPE